MVEGGKGERVTGDSAQNEYEHDDHRPEFEPQIFTSRSVSTTTSAPVYRFFQQGHCSKGSVSPFIHAAEALGENGPRPSVAKQQALPLGDRQRNVTIAEGAQIAERKRIA